MNPQVNDCKHCAGVCVCRIQSLESYQLDDLPADGRLQEVAEARKDSHPHFNLSRVNGTPASVNLLDPSREQRGILQRKKPLNAMKLGLRTQLAMVFSPEPKSSECRRGGNSDR